MLKPFYHFFAALFLIALAFYAPQAHAQYRGVDVVYYHQDTELEGYVVEPEGATKDTPVVLLTPAWKGLDVYYKTRADQIAARGYVVMAIDVYGRGVRILNTKQAAQMSSAFKDNPSLFRGRMKAALDFITRRRNISSDKVAVIGFCFGGTGALELARSGVELAGAVSLHGNLATKAPAGEGAINTPLLVLHGADDPIVPEKEVREFEDEMKQAKTADWQLVKYSGAVHSFTDKTADEDPSDGVAYNPKVAHRAFETMFNFLAEMFSPTPPNGMPNAPEKR